MNNNKKRRQPKTIWDFLRECPLVSLILLSVIGYTLYALVGAMGGEYKLRISKDHTLFMSAMIKEDPFVKNDDTKKPEDTTATGTDADSCRDINRCTSDLFGCSQHRWKRTDSNDLYHSSNA